MPLQQKLYREAYRMLCDQFEAEDAVQNLYLRLWEQREQLDTLIAPEAYCLKMLRNICIDRWRVIRQRDEGTLDDEMLVADAPPDNDTKDFIEHFLAGLPKEHRRVIKMHMQGMPYDEIAALVGLSEGNIRVIISRIRKRFRDSFYK
jgi:RNA polymerase sigma-70 factor (ECF subfamily)